MDERRLAPVVAADEDRDAGAPEVRGWDVIAEADGRKIGEVAGLVGGHGEGRGPRAHYLDVRLHPGAIAGGGGGSAVSGTTGEQLRAEERGMGVEHVVVREEPPAGGALLGDENPAAGAGWDSPEIRRERAEAEAAEAAGGGNGERHALVPVGRARIDHRKRQVLVEGLASVDAAALPDYRPGEDTGRAEEETRRRFAAGASRPLEGEELAADHGLFDLDHFYGARSGAGPAEPAAAPDPLPGEEEPVEAGLRPDSSGLRHEREIKPRR